MKIIISVLGIVIIAALVAAGIALLRQSRPGEARKDHMFKALALRVGVSIALFLFVLVSYLLGWIQPTGVPIGP